MDTQTRMIPRTLIIAFRMLLISVFILGPIAEILVRDQLTKWLTEIGFVTQFIIIKFICFAVLIWLLYKIALGRNWARITLLIMSIYGIALSMLFISEDFQYSLLLGLVSSAQNMLSLIALCLLFCRASAPYFKKNLI